MLKSLIVVFSLFSAAAWSCTEALKYHPEECKLHDRYHFLRTEFKKLAINEQELKGYKIPRALGVKEFNGQKNKLLSNTKQALDQNSEWHLWISGQKFINELNVVYLSPDDILKLHKNIFSHKSSPTLAADAGKLRINMGVTNPTETISCESKNLSLATMMLFEDFDLKSEEAYPLLEIQNLHACTVNGYYSADLVYYKGASMKQELNRWLNDFNDMILRYENGNAAFDTQPLLYMADMRRWFLSMAPFAHGNLEVINALSDYFMKRLELMPLPLKDLNTAQLLDPETNRELFKNRSYEVLNFIEACLYENKVKPISSDCSVI